MDIGSREWLEKRGESIGSSDAPVIMKVSPFKTPYQLWEEKVLGKEQSLNSAMKRGTEMEPLAREWFINKIGISVEPVFLKHANYGWMTATLDGYNEKESVLVEIKCPSAKTHALAKQGKVPDHYYPQVQHQLAVTGFGLAYYVSFDGQDGAVVEVPRNDKYIDTLLSEEYKFFECMTDLTPPGLTEADWVDMDINKDWQEISEQYKKVNGLIKELEEEEEFLRSQFILFSEGRNAKGCGIRLTKCLTKGNIDYTKIPELKNINLEQYRKPSYTKWRTTVDAK